MPEFTAQPRSQETTRAALLFLHAYTGLHPGAGAALGVVDLPVQRERHTQWPTIAGSSLKGILRDACRRRSADGDSDPRVAAVFGPATAEADKHAGALSVTDARILAFPVRSLRGVFAWVTCPAALTRLNRDLGFTGHPAMANIPSLGRDRIACAEESPLLVDSDKVLLEEFEFTRSGDAGDVPAWVAGNAVADEATQERVRQCLAVLHDDDFTHFVRHATEVVARIGLDYETKTVRPGALFWQEFLPPETLLYSVVLAGESRREGVPLDASALLEYLSARLPAVLQVGGDETIGKGLCATRLVLPSGEARR